MPTTYEQLEKENSELRRDLAQSEKEVKGRCNDLSDASKELADLRAKLTAAEPPRRSEYE